MLQPAHLSKLKGGGVHVETIEVPLLDLLNISDYTGKYICIYIDIITNTCTCARLCIDIYV